MLAQLQASVDPKGWAAGERDCQVPGEVRWQVWFGRGGRPRPAQGAAHSPEAAMQAAEACIRAAGVRWREERRTPGGTRHP